MENMKTDSKMKTLEVLDHILAGKRMSEAHKKHYRVALKSLAQFSEEWPTRSVTIDEWLNSISDKYADTTLHLYFQTGQAAGNYIESNYDLKNPFTKAQKIKIEKKHRRYFSSAEMLSIIKACRNDKEKTLILTFIDSTCRVGELANLETSKVGINCLDVSGKTGQRLYRCDPILCKQLIKLGGDSKYVFHDKNGNQLSSGTLGTQARRVIKAAGITGLKVGPHTLRHSGASLVAQVTGSALAVKALLQHDKIDTSMEYIHDTEDILQQRISPLKLMGDQVYGEIANDELKQLELKSGINETPLDQPIEQNETPTSNPQIIDLFELEFDEIKENITIRSQLNSDDLNLLRRAMIAYAKTGTAGQDKDRSKALLRRMLRKVK